jgi:GntR family transcriptional regulator
MRESKRESVSKAAPVSMLAPSPVAPVEQLDNRLLAARARAEILQAIFDGRFDGKLPSEDKLAAMLNISRTTVRTALQSLERDGVVTRQRAIGTLINPHARPSSLALQRLVGFDGLLAERGYKVEVDLTWEWAVPPDDVVAAFPIESDQECCVIRKAYFADGTLALSVLDAVPRDVISVDELPEEIEPSLFTFSERVLVAPIHHAVVNLVPHVKNGKNSRLEIEDGEPFLRLLEVHYTARAQPVAFSVIDADNRYISLEVVRTQ